ncbi:site-specific integrase [Streptomyces sp. NBC_01210]|uniref:tyrosine-type recombinase/integrase n=1 Tax=Streptomyces sp. NBC_01210 TaxID=2903774 RepID=UPI002E124807|nr:site-specific integrase [Streptomyces sp. NBC_01210]
MARAPQMGIDELVEHRTLLEDEQALVAGKRDATRLLRPQRLPPHLRGHARYLQALEAVAEADEAGLVTAVLRDQDATMADSTVGHHLDRPAADLLTGPWFTAWALIAWAAARRGSTARLGSSRSPPRRSSARIYLISLTTWGWMLAGERAPTGPARRGAKPPLFPVAAIDDPVLPEVLAELAAARADKMESDTVNRELSIARRAIGWWQRQGWIGRDPTIGIERRPAPPDRTKALTENRIAALWRLDVALREKTCWKMLCESAARADEVLCLNVEDLHLGDKRGRTLAKGGATEWIHWQSGTAQLLPRLIAGRSRGPLFLTGRKAPAGTPTLDVCPETGRARLSYRLAEEIFEENTRLLANPLASPDDVEDLDGWTLHRLRHSALTHDAEGGTSTPMLLARSRHASVRSLERYARPEGSRSRGGR